MRYVRLTNHDHEREDVVEYQSERWCEIVKSFKVGTLHDTIQHCFEDKARHIRIVVHLIHTDECLKKPDHDDNEQRKENKRFLHHHFQYDEHGAEEAKRIQIEQ